MYGPTANNPRMMFQNNQRGYIRVEITRHQWLTDFRVSDTVLNADAPLHTVVAFRH
ncbi:MULTISPECIES: hypothetical protein [unclassified Amycolatopsis]|uniref:hypothetical protein n=1 Tax=unclassified Amycolatopsis TaxID=2618356 RepID=UPI001C69F780|nr:hypothetical protein [Amycolatopsis sp. DSM 110486]QYN19122.1 hypothetical protein K1T34_41735 [Amycolatopsis sp. DSM 110486]